MNRPTFNLDPMKYFVFIRVFEKIIERTLLDESSAWPCYLSRVPQEQECKSDRILFLDAFRTSILRSPITPPATL